MRLLQLIVFVFFISITSVWASGDPAPARTASGGEETGKALEHVKQQRLKNESEVNRLKHDVAAEQSHSDEAGKQLQQQDKAIVELRKQLQKLKASPPADEH